MVTSIASTVTRSWVSSLSLPLWRGDIFCVEVSRYQCEVTDDNWSYSTYFFNSTNFFIIASMVLSCKPFTPPNASALFSWLDACLWRSWWPSLRSAILASRACMSRFSWAIFSWRRGSSEFLEFSLQIASSTDFRLGSFKSRPLLGFISRLLVFFQGSVFVLVAVLAVLAVLVFRVRLGSRLRKS